MFKLKKIASLTFCLYLTSGCFDETIQKKPDQNKVEKSNYTIKNGFLVRSDNNLHEYHLGQITNDIKSFENDQSIPLLIDGKLIPPKSTFYTTRIKFDPSLLEEGKVYHVRDLPSNFELSWRTSEAISKGSSNCPKEVVINHEKDVICGLNWVTHTIRGGENHKANFTIQVNKATAKRISIVLDMDAYSTKLSPNSDTIYCCSLAQVNIDEPINDDGTFLSNVDPFILAYYCGFKSITETIESGCKTIERNPIEDN